MILNTEINLSTESIYHFRSDIFNSMYNVRGHLTFGNYFVSVLNKHTASKTKILRGNQNLILIRTSLRKRTIIYDFVLPKFNRQRNLLVNLSR